MSNLPVERDSFGSKFGIIAATAGSAVGLGNIWRFPLLTTQNGGGAFLIIYIGFVLLIGIPVMLSEFSIGRKAQQNALGSFKKLAPNTPWFLVGFLGILTAFAILSFYSTVAGWTLEYIAQSITGKLFRVENMHENFIDFSTDSIRPVFWQIIVMAITGMVVYVGINKGIEKFNKIFMPVLVLLIILVAIRSVTLEGAKEGIRYLFVPNWGAVTFKTALMALGQAAFSLSIGMGTLITYSSYFSKKDNLLSTASNVAIVDTVVAILSSLMVVPAIFAFSDLTISELSPGPGLVFEILPNVFKEIPGGLILSVIFFILLGLAAFTSTVSVLEVVVAWLKEEMKLSRKTSTIIATCAITLLGILATLSFGVLNGFTLFGKTVFGLLDYISANIMLTFGALFIVIFVGWKMGEKEFIKEISNDGSLKSAMFKIIFFIVRYIAPVAIGIITIAILLMKGIV